MGTKVFGPHSVAVPEAERKFTDMKVDETGRGAIKLEGSSGDTPYAFEQIMVDGTVKQLTAATYDSSTSARIAVEDAEIRFTLDGTDPTTTVGTLAYVGDVIELTSAAEIAGFKCTRATGTSAKISAHYGS